MSQSVVRPPHLQLRLRRAHGLPVEATPVPVPMTGLDIGSGMEPGMLHIDGAFYVAPLHASVLHQGETWRLLPRNPLMVSAVNGVQARQGQGLPLQPGDTVEIGFTALRVETPSPEECSPAVEPWEEPSDAARVEDTDLAALLALPPDAEDGARESVHPATTVPKPPDATPSFVEAPDQNADAAALVSLIEQDFAAVPGTLSTHGNDPLVDLLQSGEAPFHDLSSPIPAGEDDILGRLARESEHLLRDPDLTGLWDETAVYGLSEPPDIFAQPIDSGFTDALPADILPPTPETSLHDLLDGPLSVDDVLAQLEGLDDCPLLDVEVPPEDPLRLLAGDDAPAPSRVRTIAPITRRDHHSLGMGTPCHRPNAATLSPTENACRLHKK